MDQKEIARHLGGCLLPKWDTLPDFGLYKDQMLTYVAKYLPGLSVQLELTSNMINNYVKAGLMDKPDGKKYSREALAQLLMICLMKLTTPLDVMKTLLHPPDGTDTGTLYRTFSGAQQRIVNDLSENPQQPAILCALESSSLQLVLRLMMMQK